MKFTLGNAISIILVPALLMLSPVARAIKLVFGAAEDQKMVGIMPGAVLDETAVARQGLHYDVLERRSIAVLSGPWSAPLARWLMDRAVSKRGGDAYIKVSEKQEEIYTEHVDGVSFPATNLVIEFLIIKYPQ